MNHILLRNAGKTATRGAAAMLCTFAILSLASTSFAQQNEPTQSEAESAESTPQSSAVQPPSDRTEPLPPELEGVGVTERLGEMVPGDIELVNSEGKRVQLADYLDGDKPVILNLGYYGCPMLCGLVMNGLVDSMREIKMTPGEEYEVLTVSIDPGETSTLARLKKQNYVKELGDPAAAAGWHFFVGDADETRRLADSVGFNYKWNDRKKEWAHAAVLVVLTPDGRISRYLYGVVFPPTTVRLSLVEASDGKIGSTVDQLLLFCFHYDAAERKYALAAMNLMRVGGVFTITILFTAIGIALRRETRRRSAAAAADADESAGISTGAGRVETEGRNA